MSIREKGDWFCPEKTVYLTHLAFVGALAFNWCISQRSEITLFCCSALLDAAVGYEVHNLTNVYDHATQNVFKTSPYHLIWNLNVIIIIIAKAILTAQTREKGSWSRRKKRERV